MQIARTALQSTVLMLLAAGVGASARAAQADTALRDAATQAQPAVIETLRALVTTESGSTDHEGVDTLMTYLDTRLRALDARVDRLPSATGGPDLVRGVFTGNGALKVMLIAHADTVYDRGILAREPYQQKGNLLYGPGIADDKGGIAVILHALALLKARGWTDYATVTVLFNPDEEIGSPGSGETIATLAADHDVVLSFEPSPAKAVIEHEGVLLSAAGTSQVRMTVQGLSAHAGAAPEQGRNALLELAHQVVQTKDVAAGVPGAQLNWTTASAGTARNQIPERAEAGGDVRVMQADSNEKLLAALQAKVKERPLVPDTTTTVTLEPLRPIYVAGDRGRALADLARDIYAELDGRRLLMHPTTNGGTDAGFAGRSGKAAVLEGLGLAGWGYHARNEYIEIDSIPPRLYLASRMLIELGRRAHAATP
ncbi:glutamate carboxypeptidase [Pseudoxanthomonas sp.]|jgi:glutamate carboxypeptidase|uniref:glutamate carboxypeptidase n=1 Tax=Pseudoxanthomonas sp. TaxID=1871049 RepID=UPI002E0EE3DF|nr:glutamate carboxypeptidase [Pseudoxanthomonas sp.]